MDYKGYIQGMCIYIYIHKEKKMETTSSGLGLSREPAGQTGLGMSWALGCQLWGVKDVAWVLSHPQ